MNIWSCLTNFNSQINNDASSMINVLCHTKTILCDEECMTLPRHEEAMRSLTLLSHMLPVWSYHQASYILIVGGK